MRRVRKYNVFEQRAYKRAYYRDMKALGLCPKCKREAPAGRVCHVECQRRSNSRNGQAKKAWRERKIAKGLCGRCGRRPLATQAWCQVCRDRYREKSSVKFKRHQRCSLCCKLGHHSTSCSKRWKANVVEFATARRAV